MPRDKRLNIIGGIYHLYTRGIERKEIFKDNKDREEFLSRLADALDKTKSACYAWALMPNHIHLMVRTGLGSLSDIARRLLTGYAIYFNARHKRRGYLYQNRYKSILCQEDVYFQELVRYIHLNPLKSKTLSTIEQLDAYPWTGHAAIVGTKQYPWQYKNEVLLFFGKKEKEAIANYREFIKNGAGQTEKTDFLGGGLVRSAGGWSDLANMKRKKEYWRGDERILGDDSFVNDILRQSEEQLDRKGKLIREGWDLAKITNRACELTDIKAELIKKRSKNNSISEARALICYWGVKELGLPGTQIGNFLNISKQAVAKNVERGEEVAGKRKAKLTS